MDEDKPKDEELIERISKEDASLKGEVAPKKGIGKAFSDMYRLFTKPKSKDGKGGGSSEAAQPAKKVTVLKPATFGNRKINLKVTNQVLVAILVGLTVLLLYVSLREKPEVSSVVAAIANIKLPEVEYKTITKFEELSFYLGQIKKRDIFSIFQEKKKEVPVKVVEPVKAPEPPPVPVVPIEEKAKNIKLIGISWGENPKAMIKNTNTQNVQFGSIGEKIDETDLTIKKILKDEVILISEGQEMSLM